MYRCILYKAKISKKNWQKTQKFSILDRSDQKYIQKKFANKNYLKFHKKIRVEYTYNQLTLRLSHRSSDFLQADFQGQ